LTGTNGDFVIQLQYCFEYQPLRGFDIMKSLTLSGTAPSLASLPSLERSLFNWTLTTLATSTILFGLVGWAVSQQANAGETNATGATQTQLQSETIAQQ
jgi:hypothetical protein